MPIPCRPVFFGGDESRTTAQKRIEHDLAFSGEKLYERLHETHRFDGQMTVVGVSDGFFDLQHGCGRASVYPRVFEVHQARLPREPIFN